MKKNKIAIIGAGYMAEEHIKVFKSIKSVKISGIYSRTLSRASKLAKKYNIPYTAKNISDLYNKTKSHAVVICVSSINTKKVCLESFRYSWMCLIEKPIGYNYKDALFLYKKSLKLKNKIFIALNRRHYGSTIKILNDLRLSKQKRLIEVTDQEDLEMQRKFGENPKIIKNFMYANSIHLIDYINLFGRGKIKSVQPTIRWNEKKPNFILYTIKFFSGDLAIYKAFWNRPGPWSVIISTKKKRWESKPLENLNIQQKNSRKIKKIKLNIIDKKFKPGLKIQAIQFLKAINNLDNNLPTIKDGFETVKLIKKIYG